MRHITLREITDQLGSIVNVSNLESENTGREIANQFEIRFENGVIFQSYETIIAIKHHGSLYLTDAHDYSRTTSKYCTQWTGFNTKQRREMLESGEITMVDRNE